MRGRELELVKKLNLVKLLIDSSISELCRLRRIMSLFGSGPSSLCLFSSLIDYAKSNNPI